ncbi:MAG: uracil-DNA glycosylase [Candidatus Omnitrophica bacterium]|nr:uracil-DNA glycosylase [Candidatus Omnitrophota bacterium]
MPKSKIQEAKNFIQTLKEENVEEIYLSPPTSTPKILQNQKGSASTTTGTGKREQLLKLRESAGKREQLLKLRESALKCVLCDELASTRKSVVFGAGNVNARLVFVGEAPGRDEDAQGLPFVGRAGQLLTKIIESIGLSRQDAFICNTLKCRPPANRQPHPQEIINCNPFLAGQIDIIKPQIICALGTFAAQTLLRTTTPISQLRGKFHDYRGIKVVCTFHPAYLLRNPEEKRKVWEDMKTIKRELDSLGS